MLPITQLLDVHFFITLSKWHLKCLPLFTITNIITLSIWFFYTQGKGSSQIIADYEITGSTDTESPF